MDRFLFYNGGMPIYLDDIQFLDATYRETFKQLLQAFNLPSNLSCIVSGCTITGTQTKYLVSKGIVILDGELLSAPAQIINKQNTPGATYYWKIANDYYQQGYKVLENGQTVPVWEKRWAKIEYGTPPPNHLPMLGAKHLLDYVTQYVAQNIQKEVEEQLIIPSSAFFPGWSNHPTQPLRVYRDLTNRVYLAGSATTNNYQNSNIFTLPASYRPQLNHAFLVHGINNLLGRTLFLVEISNSGIVSITHIFSPNVSPKDIIFDGISFRLTD